MSKTKLNSEAVKRANAAFHMQYPAMKGKPIDPANKEQVAKWRLFYNASKAFIESKSPEKQKNLVKKSNTKRVGSAVASCPLIAKKENSSLMDLRNKYHSGDYGTKQTGKVTKRFIKGEAGVASLSTVKSKGNLGGASFDLKVATVKADANLVTGDGLGANVNAEVQALSMDGSVFVGEKNNPLAEVGGGYKLFAAEAKGDLLIGDDGDRVGFVARGNAGAAVAGGNVENEINIPIPFTNSSIAWRGSLSGDVGGVGIGGGVHSYYSKKEERTHWGVMGGLLAGIGGTLDVDISIGKKYQSRNRWWK